MSSLNEQSKAILRDAIDHVVPKVSVWDKDGEYYDVATVGAVGACISLVDSDERAMRFVDSYVGEVEPYEQYDAWKNLAMGGVAGAVEKVKATAGIVESRGGYELRPDVEDDLGTMYRLADLVALGEERALPLAHRLIPDRPPYANYPDARTRMAQKLYEAGDLTAIDLAVLTARQARKSALAQLEKKELNPAANADSTIANVFIEALAEALSLPRGEQLGGLYDRTDIALWGLAVSALARNRVEDAEKARAEMIGVSYGCKVDTEFVVTGNDPEGLHRRNINDALGVYIDDMGRHAFGVVNKLIAAGDPEFTRAYTETFIENDRMNPHDIPPDALAALAIGGNQRAGEILKRTAYQSEMPEQYTKPLVSAGMEVDALTLARRIYSQEPSRNNALRVLNIKFSLPIWHELSRMPIGEPLVYPGDSDEYYRVKDLLMLARNLAGKSDFINSFGSVV